tara:strand:+ start:70 stop:333 length:264 start_codon:yes stop_codon:yes gene_type:complete
MKIVINRQWEDFNDSVYLGTVEPPNDLLADNRSQEDTFWQTLIGLLWGDWQEEVLDPDSDDDFIDWLVVERDWMRVESDEIHVNVGL